MIRFFIFSLLALLAGAVLSILLGEEPGYVLVSFRDYTVETSLIVVILALLLAWVAVIGVGALFRLINPLSWLRSGKQLFNVRQRAWKDTEQGVLLLCEGNAREAYRLLLQHAEHVETPVVNYLLAALAAFRLGDRNAWLYCVDRARRAAPQRITAVESFKAWLEMHDGNLERSLALLLELKKQHPGNPHLLNLIKEVYRTLEDWEQLESLLPELEKQNLLSPKEIEEMNSTVGLYKLRRARGNPVALEQAWESIPKKYRGEEKLLLAYATGLSEAGKDARAMSVLTQQLRQNWNDNLVAMLGYIDSGDPAQQLLWLEKWVKDRPNNAVLLLTLGRVSLRNRLWGKGKEYLEAALQFSQSQSLTAEINAELARLLEHLGEHERSVACYQRTMGLLERKLPDLPMPEEGRMLGFNSQGAQA